MSGPQPTATPKDRLLQALRAIIREESPRLTFFGLYEFIVQSSTGSQASMVPSDLTVGLPGLVQVTQRLSGTVSMLTPGSMCLVQFVNGDPTRPIVVNGAPVPLTTTIDATVSMSLGSSCPVIGIGAVPAPLATSLGTTSTIALLTTFVASVSAAANTCATSGGSPAAVVTFCTAVNTAGGAVSTGLSAALALIPTLTVKAGP